MALYNLAFTVTPDGVTPTVPQRGGVYGDKGQAVVTFTVPFNGDYRYRVEITDGAGGYDVTELMTPENGTLTLPIPAAWTVPGIAALRLVAVVLNEDLNEETVFHSAPCYVCFESRDSGDRVWTATEGAWQAVMAKSLNIAEQAAERSERAEEYADNATQASHEAATHAEGAIEAAEQSMNAAKQAVSAATLAAELAAEAIEKADAPKPAAAVTVERGDENFIPLGDNVQTALGNLSTALLRYDNEVHERMDDMGDTLADVELGVHDLEIKHDRYERDARQLFAGALKGTAEGAAVTLHDVSPVPHEVAVTVSDPAARVVVGGKNIFDVHSVGTYHTLGHEDLGVYATITDTGMRMVKNGDSESVGTRFGFCLGTPQELAGKTITISGKYCSTVTHKNAYLYWFVGGTDIAPCPAGEDIVYSNGGYIGRSGSTTGLTDYSKNAPVTYTVTGEEGFKYLCVVFYIVVYAPMEDGDVSELSDIQVEFGDTATVYEPYKERKEYAQGEAVLSVSPSMSITTDTAGALVSVEYNKDTNKVVYDLLERISVLEAAVVNNA